MNLSKEIVYFFSNQGFVIVSTLDPNGTIHCSAKGIAGINESGEVFLIDLYHAQTFSNLEKNPGISITSINEQQFVGFTLKGKAKIVKNDAIDTVIIDAWHQRVVKRISNRVIGNLQRDQKTGHHPEAKFGSPAYLILMQVEEVVDLTPNHLKK